MSKAKIRKRLASKKAADKARRSIDKGILDTWRALTIAERADMALLQDRGIDGATARQLAMRDARKSAVAKRDYASAYVSAAKQVLDADTYARIQRTARGSAGGVASKRARAGRTDATKAEAIALAKRLRARAAELLRGVDKSAPTISEVLPGGVPSAGGGYGKLQLPKKRQASVAKRHVLAQMADDYIAAAYGNSGMLPPNGYQAPGDCPELDRYIDAQRLVAGMDHERLAGLTDPSEARARASRNLSYNMRCYDKSFPPSDTQLNAIGGLSLDLGCGSAREAGSLGIDLYPYDHGTIIHDLGMGIPFPDGSAKCIRLHNALADMPDYADKPLPLLAEVERVLGIGGRFYYTGAPLDGLVDWERLPGLHVLRASTTVPSDDDVTPTQTITVVRRAQALPLVYGADTQYLKIDETTPMDVRMAMLAYGKQPGAQTAMANLVGKSADAPQQVAVSTTCPIIKRDAYKRIVYGVVLAPDVEDSQGDIMSADDIEEAAHAFMRDYRVVGNEHDNAMEGAEVVESYIAPSDIDFSGGPYGPQNVPKGAWVLAVRLATEEQFAKVLDGEFTGFSVGGHGERVPA